MSKAAAKEAKTQRPPAEPAAAAPSVESAATAAETAPTEAVAQAAPVTLSPQDYEDLRVKAGKAEEHWDRLLRTMADFDNFRKRAAREKQEAIKYANESLITKLLPVLDSFEAALAAAGEADHQTAEALRTGVAMVLQQLTGVLTEAGVEQVDATGQAFDPNWHEAISQQECAETPEGHVLQQLRKGYKLRDRLLRPATVIVAKHPEAVPAA